MSQQPSEQPSNPLQGFTNGALIFSLVAAAILIAEGIRLGSSGAVVAGVCCAIMGAAQATYNTPTLAVAENKNNNKDEDDEDDEDNDDNESHHRKPD